MDLLKDFSQYMRQALEGMTGHAPELEVRPLDTFESPDAVFWWEQPIDLSPGAIIWVGGAETAWSGIGGQVLTAAGVDDASDQDRRSTYLEVLQQALSPLARAIGLSLGREVVCQAGKQIEKTPETIAAEVLIKYPSQMPLRLWIGFAPGLVAVLSNNSAPAAEPQPVAAPVDSGVPDGPSRTLDLLLEVELPVSISFGRAHVPLKDVLKLTSGSIVELNRGVQEPVEVIVNNCVIARGEVVVVEGNYGVKINQIVSRQERLRSLY